MPHDLAIPVDAQRCQIGQLTLRDLRGGRDPLLIEILDTQQEGTGIVAGQQPGQHSGAQIAQMQIGRGAGSEASGRHGW
ncbi:hypothetical protein SDC9_148956 [bioreactor metagenome]|uniref:Uncharacterized protein n=1 Tax=bioreactor metagenome TaxID=1076179 RepID=A0A645EIB4_9ZZZZ